MTDCPKDSDLIVMEQDPAGTLLNPGDSNVKHRSEPLV